MLSLQPVCSRLRVFVFVFAVCCIPIFTTTTKLTTFAKLPPPQKYDISFSCSCVLCCVSYAVADIWMMIYVIFARVSCSCPGSVPLCVDIV